MQDLTNCLLGSVDFDGYGNSKYDFGNEKGDRDSVCEMILDKQQIRAKAYNAHDHNKAQEPFLISGIHKNAPAEYA